VSGTVVGGQHLGFSSAPLDFPHLGCALWLRRDSKIRLSDMELGVAFFFYFRMDGARSSGACRRLRSMDGEWSSDIGSG